VLYNHGSVARYDRNPYFPARHTIIHAWQTSSFMYAVRSRLV
jgi:hypothetical protein